MLISDQIYINTNNRNYKKFIDLGYNFLFIIDKNYEDLKKIINKL